MKQLLKVITLYFMWRMRNLHTYLKIVSMKIIQNVFEFI